MHLEEYGIKEVNMNMFNIPSGNVVSNSLFNYLKETELMSRIFVFLFLPYYLGNITLVHTPAAGGGNAL